MSGNPKGCRLFFLSKTIKRVAGALNKIKHSQEKWKED